MDIHKSERNFHPLTFSDIEVVKYLILLRYNSMLLMVLVMINAIEQHLMEQR